MEENLSKEEKGKKENEKQLPKFMLTTATWGINTVIGLLDTGTCAFKIPPKVDVETVERLIERSNK